MFCFCCPRFTEDLVAQQKDSNGSTWCFEIHSTYRLSDLQVGQPTKVEDFSTFPWCEDLPQCSRDPGLRPQDPVFSPFSQQLDREPSHWASLNVPHLMCAGCVTVCRLVAELLLGMVAVSPLTLSLVWTWPPRHVSFSVTTQLPSSRLWCQHGPCWQVW